jgi:hypothetical protein
MSEDPESRRRRYAKEASRNEKRLKILREFLESGRGLPPAEGRYCEVRSCIASLIMDNEALGDAIYNLEKRIRELEQRP